MLKGIIFDFDGLILDTETPIFNAWQKVYSSFGIDLPFDLWITTIGSSEVYFDPIKYLRSITNISIDDSEVLQIYSQYETEMIANEVILPGILELILCAHKNGIKLAIASSSPITWVRNHAKKLGIEKYFSSFSTKDEVKITKPHPALYLLALQKMNLTNTEVVALEDSLHGIQAARDAGIFTIAIPANMTINLDFSTADMVVPTASSIDLDDVNEKLVKKWQGMQ